MRLQSTVIGKCLDDTLELSAEPGRAFIQANLREAIKQRGSMWRHVGGGRDGAREDDDLT